MARYFFHVNDRRDTLGLKMTGLLALRRHARAIAGHLADQGVDWTISVTDEKGATLLDMASPSR